VIARYIPYPRDLTRAAVLASYLLDALALIALALPATRRAPKALWLFPAMAGLTIVSLSGNIRYRATIEPFTVLLASVTAAWVLERTPWLGAGESSAAIATA
jgi:hypothetical protein